MKKKIVYFTMVVLFACILYDCSKHTIFADLAINEKTLDVEFLNAIPTDGGSRELEFNSSSDWTITINDSRSSSWLSVTPSSGKAGSVVANITATKNNTPDERQSKITISASSTTKHINVIQKQKDALTITSSHFEVANTGGNIDVEIISNVEFDISFDSDWISQITTRTLETNNLKFKIEPYDGEMRSGKIIIKDKNTSLSESITITQAEIIPPSLYESTDYSKDGEVLTLQTATIGNGIDLVIVGDAFSDKDMTIGGRYEQRIGEAMDHFFSEEPYKTYRNRYNVYSVKAVSKNEVYEEGSKTVFSCEFLGGTGINGDHEKIFTYAFKVPSITDTKNLTVITILNSPIYAGTCYMWTNKASIAYCPIVNNDDEQYRQIITHEAGGHGFAKLLDEYSYSGSITMEAEYDYQIWKGLGWGVNSDITNDPASIRWAHILSDTRYTGLVGIYEGSLTFEQGAYRPTVESIMRHNTAGFNPPSREAIFNWIMEFSGESYNYEKFVAYDAKNRTAGAMATRRAQAERVDTKNFVPLAPPVLIISSPKVSK